MKKYRVKQWYPSLLKDVRVGDIITENGQHYKGVTYKGISYRVEIWQLHPDLWELIEEEKPKPLFITDDGVEVYDIDSLVFAVKGDFLKIQLFALAFCQNKNDMKSFYHEANADEYIWRNKPLFSYNDIEKFQSGGEGAWWNVKAIAIERSEE